MSIDDTALAGRGEQSSSASSDRLISAEEAAAILGVTPRGVAKMAEAGMLEHELFPWPRGHLRLYSRAAVVAFAAEREAIRRRKLRRPMPVRRSRARHLSAPEATA